MPEGQICCVDKNSTTANLIRESGMILMDEVAMMNRKDLERLDKTWRDLTGVNKPFGGKNVIIGGDFRQILPVARNEFETIDACIKSSYLWQKFSPPRSLAINERVNRMKDKADKSYAEFLLRLGIDEMEEFKIPKFDDEGNYHFLKLPEKYDIMSKSKSLDQFLLEMYPEFSQDDVVISDEDDEKMAEDIPKAKKETAIILTPLNTNMHDINEKCLKLFRGEDVS